MTKEKRATNGHWQRFFNNGNINLIQCAEHLEDPRGILENTYTNCTWQNETIGEAEGVARGTRSELVNLGQFVTEKDRM